VSSRTLSYLSTVATAIGTEFTLQGVPVGERAWVVRTAIPAPDVSVDITQDVMLDILAEGDDVLSDGSGHGCQLGMVVAVAITDTLTDTVARTVVADAVELIRATLQAPANKCRADKFSVAFEGIVPLFGARVYQATVGIERKLV